MSWIEFFQYYIAHHLPTLLATLVPVVIGILTYRHAKVAKEAVTRNHGSSMADAVARMEAKMELYDLHILGQSPSSNHKGSS
jgi:Na+/H+ antiporter NhaD/arsenite permease-like protein